MLEVAKALFDALEKADLESLDKLYAPDAVLWTNIGGQERDARKVAQYLPAIVSAMPDRRYVDRQVDLLISGFVHRHRITATRADGSRAEVACCALVKVRDGKVTRIDEYLDAGQLASFQPG